ncbi:hypothetical protein [Bacillus phage YungSlug]|nr:hypothetical protein [Bacillus phage YungSlug]
MTIERIKKLVETQGQPYYEAIVKKNERIRNGESVFCDKTMLLGPSYDFWNNPVDDIYDIVEGHENSTDKLFIHNQQEYLKVAKKLLVTKKTVCRKKLLIKLKEKREILTSTIKEMERMNKND